MPWYKLFDEKNMLWDGVLRYNSYPINPPDEINKEGVWLPSWVLGGGGFTKEILMQAYETGPDFPMQQAAAARRGTNEPYLT